MAAVSVPRKGFSLLGRKERVSMISTEISSSQTELKGRKFIFLVIIPLFLLFLSPVQAPAETRLISSVQGANTNPVWSPDGNKLLFLSGPQIKMANSSGAGDAATLNEGISGPCSRPAWSPKGGKHVVFSAPSGEGDTDIFLVPTASGGSYSPEPAFMSMSDEANPGWLSYSQIVFEAEDDLWMFSLTEKTKYTILNSGHSPLPSPDGTRVLFKRDGTLFMLVVKTGKLTSLGSGSSPARSPDNSHVAYEKNGDINIRKVSADNTLEKQLTVTETTETSPSWSKDSKLLAFSANTRGNYDIWVYHLDDNDGVDDGKGNIVNDDDGAVYPATFGDEDETSPVFSPADSRIAYVRAMEKGSAIYTTDYPPTMPSLPTGDPQDTLSARDWPMISRDSANTNYIPLDEEVEITANPTLKLDGSLRGIPRIYAISIRDDFFVALQGNREKPDLIGGPFNGTGDILKPAFKLTGVNRGRPFHNVWPCIYHDQIFAAAGGDNGNSFLTSFAKDGSLVWKKLIKGTIQYAIIPRYGHLFVVSDDILHAYTSDGLLRWSYTLSSLDGNWSIAGPPAVLDKQVFLAIRKTEKVLFITKERYGCLQIDASDGTMVSLVKADSFVEPLLTKVETIVPTARQVEANQYDVYIAGNKMAESRLMKFRSGRVTEKNIPKMMQGHLVLAPASINARIARRSPDSLNDLGRMPLEWAPPRIKQAGAGNNLFTVGLGDSFGRRLLAHIRTVNLTTGNEDFRFTPQNEYTNFTQFINAMVKIPFEPMVICASNRAVVILTDIERNTTDLYLMAAADAERITLPNSIILPQSKVEANNSYLFKSAKTASSPVIDVLTDTALTYTWKAELLDAGSVYTKKAEQQFTVTDTDTSVIDVEDTSKLPKYVNDLKAFKTSGYYRLSLSVEYIDPDNMTKTQHLNTKAFHVTESQLTGGENILYAPIRLEHTAIQEGSLVEDSDCDFKILPEMSLSPITDGNRVQYRGGGDSSARQMNGLLPGSITYKWRFWMERRTGHWTDVTPVFEDFHPFESVTSPIIQPTFDFPTPGSRYKVGLEVKFRETSWEPMLAKFEKPEPVYETQEVGKDDQGNPIYEQVKVGEKWVPAGALPVGFWQAISVERTAAEVQSRPAAPSKTRVKIDRIIGHPHEGPFEPPVDDWRYVGLVGCSLIDRDEKMQCIIKDGVKPFFLSVNDRTPPEISESQTYQPYTPEEGAYCGANIMISCTIRDNHPVDAMPKVDLYYEITPAHLLSYVTSDPAADSWIKYPMVMRSGDPAPNGFATPVVGGKWEQKCHWISNWQEYETASPIVLPEEFKGGQIFRYYIRAEDTSGNVNKGDLDIRGNSNPPGYGADGTDFGIITVEDNKKPNIKLVVFPESSAAEINYDPLIFEIRGEGELLTDTMIPEGNAIRCNEETVTFSHDAAESGGYYFPAFPEDTRFSFFLGVDDNVKFDAAGPIDPIRSCVFKIIEGGYDKTLRNYIPPIPKSRDEWDAISVEDDPNNAYTSYTFRIGNDGRDEDDLRDPDKAQLGVEVTCVDHAGNIRTLCLNFTIQEIQVRLRLLEQKVRTSFAEDEKDQTDE